jgi:hypothetical protein
VTITAYLHESALGVWFLSLSPDRLNGEGSHELHRRFGCSFRNELHPEGESREAVLAWAEAHGVTVQDGGR